MRAGGYPSKRRRELLESGGTLLTLDDVDDKSALLRSGTDIVGSSRAWALGTTSTSVLELKNTTPATAGVTVQYSPGLLFGGTAWDTTGPGPSRTEDWLLENDPVTGASPSSSLYLRSRQDAGAFTTRAYLNSFGVFVAVGAIGATNNAVKLDQADISTGLGVTANLRTSTAASPIGITHRARTDSAGNIVAFVDYDRGAASITNAATMPLLSCGWTNDANVYAQLAGIYCDGHMQLTGPLHLIGAASASGTDVQVWGPSATEGLQRVMQEEILSPDAIETPLSVVIPKGSAIKSVQGNADSALTGGGTTVTWSLGTAADPDKYGTAGWPTQADSLAQNSKSDWVAGPSSQLSADETIVLTGCATGGAADGNTKLSVGSVRIVVIYDTFLSLANT